MSSSNEAKSSGRVQTSVNNLATIFGRNLDYILPSQKREQWKQQSTKFATQHPYLAGFIVSQLAICVLPFSILTIMVFLFTLLAGILAGALGAFLFITGVMGFALLIIIPMTILASGAAILIWFWGAVAYMMFNWFRPKDARGSQTALQTEWMKASDPTNGTTQGDLNHGPRQQQALQSGLQMPRDANPIQQPQSRQTSSPNLPDWIQQFQSPNSQVAPGKPLPGRTASPKPRSDGTDKQTQGSPAANLAPQNGLPRAGSNSTSGAAPHSQTTPTQIQNGARSGNNSADPPQGSLHRQKAVIIPPQNGAEQGFGSASATEDIP
jgi:hypothetical protein